MSISLNNKPVVFSVEPEKSIYVKGENSFLQVMNKLTAKESEKVSDSHYFYSTKDYFKYSMGIKEDKCQGCTVKSVATDKEIAEVEANPNNVIVTMQPGQNCYIGLVDAASNQDYNFQMGLVMSVLPEPKGYSDGGIWTSKASVETMQEYANKYGVVSTEVIKDAYNLDNTQSSQVDVCQIDNTEMVLG